MPPDAINALAQYTLSGLTTGSVYALLALGYSLIFNATGIVNFTQGDFLSLGGLVLYSLLVSQGLPIVAAFPATILVVAMAGALVERVCLRPARSRQMIVLIFITMAASTLMRGLMKEGWGKLPLPLPPLSPEVPFRLLGAVLTPQNLWVMGMTLCGIAALAWFFRATVTGKAMRAAAADPRTARLMGVEVERLTTLSFAFAGALGALGGMLITPITSLSYDIGLMLGLKGFAAAVLGGYGSFAGAVAGGVLLGLFESYGAGYVTSAYRDVLVFGLLILVLFVRPQGLFGTTGRRA